MNREEKGGERGSRVRTPVVGVLVELIMNYITGGRRAAERIHRFNPRSYRPEGSLPFAAEC